MPSDTTSAKHRLLDVLLARKAKTDLATYVEAQRSTGVSWRLIAQAVTNLTGEDVSNQTLIDWFVEPGTDDGAA